ncbi:MAG: hypothetical protein ACRENE_30190, partial [Polyangiaceae bacterium]
TALEVGVASLVAIASSGCKRDSSAAGASSEATATVASPAPAPGAPAGKGVCGVITPSEASQALDVSSFDTPSSVTIASVTMCTFSDARRAHDLTLRFETGRSLQDFATIVKLAEKTGEKTATYSGLGDAAATLTLGPSNGITWLQNGTVILLEGSHFTTDRLATLARKIASRR